MSADARILVVDDDADVLAAARLLLKRHFAHVETVDRPEELPTRIADAAYDAVLLDMNFSIGANSGREGTLWLKRILEVDAQAVVILMTAYGDVETAVRAIKEGATDFVLKPWENQKLVATVNAAVQLSKSRRALNRLQLRERELVEGMRPASSEIIGQSDAMRGIYELIQKAAPTDADVLILGENGTGKELVAREIHRLSARSDDPFVTVDLGAVSEPLFESELFGHVKGAFTGAHKDRVGRFQIATGGTLLLDEVGNLPMHLQSKLLSALERREVLPIGGNEPVPIDVRLICSTNRPLAKMVEAGSFREDLLYRINTVVIELPPLRERDDDIALLLEHYLQLYTRKYEMPRKRLSGGALNFLREYRWPGNVRELSHAVERALIFSGGDILEVEDFFLTRSTGAEGVHGIDLDDYNLDQVEKVVVRRVLVKHEGNISRAANELGITRTSLYRRMAKYGL